MKIGKIIIGSRGSKLALIYAEKAKDALKNVFNGNIEIKKFQQLVTKKIKMRDYLKSVARDSFQKILNYN